jgi:hypothetical protein
MSQLRSVSAGQRAGFLYAQELVNVAKRTRVSEQERASIIAALGTGKSCNQLAREFERSPDTVSRIARDAGHVFGHTNTENANEARRRYGRDERLATIAEFIDKARELLKDMDGPRYFQGLTVGTAVMFDKRRQEDESNERRGGYLRGFLEFHDATYTDEPDTVSEHPGSDGTDQSVGR